jgi:zinc transport system ATP-binding protein
VKAEPELLPSPLTLRLYEGPDVIFTSEKHWLHPLFDLEDFFRAGGHDPARTRLVDQITGRAAAFLVARLGIRELETRVLSRRAVPVLQEHGVTFRCHELVDRILCATEELLADTLSLEEAWALLQERRTRALKS